MGYPMACSSAQVSLINSQRYQQDSDVVYVINAVYAAAFAIHKTLVSTCGKLHIAWAAVRLWKQTKSIQPHLLS